MADRTGELAEAGKCEAANEPLRAGDQYRGQLEKAPTQG